MTVMRRLRHDERGFALIIALAATIVLTITITAVIEFTSSNSRASNIGHGQQSANQIAEAGINAAYSVLNYYSWVTLSGNNATDPTLLGCATGAGGSSDCTTKTLKCVSVLTTCPTASSDRVAGTASYYGSYNATNTTWTIYATGYARNPTGAATLWKNMSATSTVYTDTNTPPNIAAWNHLYSTASAGAGCELDVNGNSVIVNVPVYVTGDMCISGNGASVQETTGGQAVDLRVVGRLVLNGNNSKVGTDATHPITSGVIGGGCSSTIGGATSACGGGSWNYWVGTTSTLQTLIAPTVSAADATSWYNAADPGPMHGCKAGTTPAPFANSKFDGDTTQNNSVATAFDLTPSTSYSCQSQTGSGQLSWDATNKLLTISGVIFIDGSMTLTQSATYSGKATIYVAGSATFPNQTTNICGVASCDFNAWLPNTNMLMIAALGSGNAVNFTGNTDKFQGSLFTNPTSTVNFGGQSITLEGPIVAGKVNWGNNVVIKPLPTITQLPPGAPLAVNAHATPGPLNYTSG